MEKKGCSSAESPRFVTVLLTVRYFTHIDHPAIEQAALEEDPEYL